MIKCFRTLATFRLLPMIWAFLMHPLLVSPLKLNCRMLLISITVNKLLMSPAMVLRPRSPALSPPLKVPLMLPTLPHNRPLPPLLLILAIPALPMLRLKLLPVLLLLTLPLLKLKLIRLGGITPLQICLR